MQRLFYIVVSGLLLGCVLVSCFYKRKNKPVVYEKKIAITGSAKNIGGQAAVIGDSAGKYFIRGMNEWETGWVNQRIKVIGDLEVNSTGEISYIKDAVVQMLNE
jgi:hypothetical protein